MTVTRRLALLAAPACLATITAACAPSGGAARGKPGSTPPAGAAPTATAWRAGSFTTNGATLHYSTRGDLTGATTPLLLLHGGFMKGDDMKPFADAVAAGRPIILLDQRAHGRSTDRIDVPLTYQEMGDDCAALVQRLGLSKVDVLGYSMGGAAALQMVLRHPDTVGKLVILSSVYRHDGWYPAVPAGIKKLNAEDFAKGPFKTNYFERVRDLNADDPNVPDDQVRAIRSPTMIIAGDADAVRPEHLLGFYRLRGGPDPQAAATGTVQGVPKARLMIVPGGSHLGMLANAPQIGAAVEAFLADQPAPLPREFQAPPNSVPME